MIKVENIETYGWKSAIRGMRNPMNSWDKSDSKFIGESGMLSCVGENDLTLMKKLYKAGTEHRKYARQIFVSMDITAPLYWWKEMDQTKVGTVTNSCSSMHKIHAKEFTLDDFSCEHLQIPMIEMLKHTIHGMNDAREAFIETKDKLMWWQMIQLLPSSYNQRRTLTMNYENVFSIIRQRSGHKLDEWREFVNILKELPYVKEITGEKKNENS